MKMTRSIKCEFLEWEFECPKKWNNLTPTKDDNIKFCESCHSNVYYSNDDAQLTTWANEGRCTAFESIDPNQPGVLMGSLRMPLSENEKKGEIFRKIKAIKSRIAKYGETPEQLSRLANLYSFLGDDINTEKYRKKANA